MTVGARGRFEGKVAVVTGAGNGMGRVHAEQFSAEGASVVVVDIQEDLATSVASGLPRALAVQCDVSKRASVLDMAARAIDAFGRIDVLVNNAGGGLVKVRPFGEVTDEDWDHVIGVNLRGAWLASQAVLPSMQANGYGKIVNIASTSAFLGHNGRTPYAAAKGGIVSLTRTMALELGPMGITVNTVAPGFTETGRVKPHIPAEEREAARQYYRKLQALPRPGQPVDISNAVLFLSSPESDFITGQLLMVDGGSVFH